MRAVSDAQTSLAAHAQAAAKIGCAGSAAACGVVLLAADKTIAAASAASKAAPPAKDIAEKTAKGADNKSVVARNNGPRASANSLTASDLAPPWRGHKIKSGA